MSYIVTEGLDFAGKSFLVEQLGEIYKSRLVSEPFSESLASSKIREMVRGAKHAPDYETQLLIAGRIEMFRKLGTYSAKNSSAYLIGDRSFITNMVYQGDTAADMKRIMELNVETLQKYGLNILPDLVIYIKVPFEVALERSKKRGLENNLDVKVMKEDTYKCMQARYEQALDILAHYSKHTKILRITHETPIKNLCALIDEHMRTVDDIIVRKYEDAIPA